MMKNKGTLLLILIAMALFAVSCGQQSSKEETHEAKTITKEQLAEGFVVEAACGECMFKLPGNGCDLAVKINGKAYFVDGVDMDAHGDAHAKDGFCSVVREAKVKGAIVNDRFVAESFELLAMHDHDGHDHDGESHDEGHDEHAGHDHDGHSH